MAAQYLLPSSGAILHIRLIAARHLKVADVTGKSDPYVIFRCGNAEGKSTIKSVRIFSFYFIDIFEPEFSQSRVE